MGTRGPTPNPSAVKRLNGDRRRNPRPCGRAADPLKRLPTAPKSLEIEAKRFWKAAGTVLVEGGRLTESDLPLFRELAEAAGMVARLRAAVGADLTVPGSSGQAVVNPLLVECRQWAAALARLAERFGLTPGARLRIAPPPASPPGADERRLAEFIDRGGPMAATAADEGEAPS